MDPHWRGSPAPAEGFNCALRQIVMLLLVVHAPGGFGQGNGLGGLEFTGIWPGSRLDACNTAEIALSTVMSVGKVDGTHVAHDARAAVIAPCCAACVIVE